MQLCLVGSVKGRPRALYTLRSDKIVLNFPTANNSILIYLRANLTAPEANYKASTST
jgi:hypothetical protein